jgi:hypothetical protein
MIRTAVELIGFKRYHSKSVTQYHKTMVTEYHSIQFTSILCPNLLMKKKGKEQHGTCKTYGGHITTVIQLGGEFDDRLAHSRTPAKLVPG